MTALTLSFSFSACSEDDKDKTIDPSQVQGSASISDLVDTGSEITWTTTVTMTSGGLSFTVVTKSRYGYTVQDGKKVFTSNIEEETFDNETIAQSAYAEMMKYKETDSSIVYELKGRTIIATFKDGYQYLTEDSLLKMYETFKTEVNNGGLF